MSAEHDRHRKLFVNRRLVAELRRWEAERTRVLEGFAPPQSIASAVMREIADIRRKHSQT